MNEGFTVVCLIFLVAITPSLSDAAQIDATYPGAWVYVAVWYVILLAILAGTWRVLR